MLEERFNDLIKTIESWCTATLLTENQEFVYEFSFNDKIDLSYKKIYVVDEIIENFFIDEQEGPIKTTINHFVFIKPISNSDEIEIELNELDVSPTHINSYIGELNKFLENIVEKIDDGEKFTIFNEPKMMYYFKVKNSTELIELLDGLRRIIYWLD